jgi:hypothetical protein
LVFGEAAEAREITFPAHGVNFMAGFGSRMSNQWALCRIEQVEALVKEFDQPDRTLPMPMPCEYCRDPARKPSSFHFAEVFVRIGSTTREMIIAGIPGHGQ